MNDVDLRTPEGLKKFCEEVEPSTETKPDRKQWREELTTFLEEIRNTSKDERSSVEFQSRIWNDNRLSSAGQGNISMDRAIADPEFREWVAGLSDIEIPTLQHERVELFSGIYDEMLKRLEPFCDRRPHLKIFRVLGTLFPGEFTTIGHRRNLRSLHKAMFGYKRANAVERHINVLARLNEVLGKPEPGPEALVRRVMLPWLLYADGVAATDVDSTEKVKPRGDTELIPLPVARRRRGLTPLRGGLSSMLAALEFVSEDPTREQLLDFLRVDLPDYKDSSLGVVISVLQGEFGVVKMDGDRYTLTDRGEAFLESEDPDELSDFLLTRVMGIDHVLVGLLNEKSINRRDLVSRIQSINPGWTTTFVPSALLNWVRLLGLISLSADGTIELTDAGRGWAERIHWKPESLPRDDEIELTISDEEETEAPERHREVELPSLDHIVSTISEAGIFEKSLISEFHAGLWAHPRRHFGILTGLSGSGKTLLARQYGRALVGQGPVSKQLAIVAVQPGWYDPGVLLGYVNPLRGDSYVRTPFLEFLLAAVANPSLPYTVILDEMNLSRPEQYLAPLLSGMESGARIHFHAEEDNFDGIPRSVRYPSNLVLIGTVNMDETTHGLSDKVLDRAFTLEFWDIDLADYPKWGKRTLSQQLESSARKTLGDLMKALAPARLHFGWRVVDDVLDFLELTEKIHESQAPETSLDSVVFAKVIPKLRGDDSPRTRDAFLKCREALQENGLKRSERKVAELLVDLETTGSARFWR